MHNIYAQAEQVKSIQRSYSELHAFSTIVRQVQLGSDHLALKQANCLKLGGREELGKELGHLH